MYETIGGVEDMAGRLVMACLSSAVLIISAVLIAKMWIHL